METPNQEQHIYSTLAIVEYLLRSTKDTIYNTKFKEADIIRELDQATISVRATIEKMETTIKKTQRPSRVCY